MKRDQVRIETLYIGGTRVYVRLVACIDGAVIRELATDSDRSIESMRQELHELAKARHYEVVE